MRVVAAASLAVLVLAPRPARGDEATVQIREHLAIEPSCLDAANVAADIARLRGRDDVPARARLVVRGDPFAPAGVEVEIRVDGVTVAERDFEAFEGACADAEAAIALAIAMDLDELEARAATPPLAATPPPVTTTATSKPPTPTRRGEPHVHLDVDAEGFVSFWTFDAAEPGASAGLSLTTKEERLRLRAAAWSTAPGAIIIGRGEASTHATLGRIDGCGSPIAAEPLRVWLCAGVGAGRLFSTSFYGVWESHALQIPVFARGAIDLRLAERVAARAAFDEVVSTERAVFRQRSPNGSVQHLNLPHFGSTLGIGLVVTIY